MATIKERIIKRLNRGFGLNIPLDSKWIHHDGRGFRSSGALSWYLSDARTLHCNYGASVMRFAHGENNKLSKQTEFNNNKEYGRL